MLRPQRDTAERIQADVEHLCSYPDRHPGSESNRAAAGYILERMREAGLETRSIAFEVPEWRDGASSIEVAGKTVRLQPGPFSAGIEADRGVLMVVRSASDIPRVPTPDAVLLLCDEIASDQFTPRNYPFYSNPQHTEIVDALEATGCLAILAATTESAMTGAMSPFPLIEEVGFPLPTAYLDAETGAWLAEHAGEPVTIAIDSVVTPSEGEQPIGRIEGSRPERVIVSAHFDTKPNTPGAIDNASGVAVLLAVAELLRETPPAHTVEFVPFNGEDHVLAPGELAWLGANPDLSDVGLEINVDAPGLAGLPSAYSLYEVDATLAERIAQLAGERPDIALGPSWPASDHMIFAMRGIPSVAITSTDFASASRIYSHTPRDIPAILDYDLLAGSARFIADIILTL